jgi:serine protease Do
MSHSQNGHSSLKTASLKTALKATTVGGLAALMLSTGIAAPILHSFAAPVEVNAPQVPSFANVVDAVSPAVVSVRVQSNVQPASDDSSNFSFNFGGRGLDQLPDDHPLKRFFKEFGGPNQDRSDRGPNRHRDGKGPLRPVAQGSGFFISEDGYIVTNNHVVDDGSAYTIVMNDGTELDAKLVGRDPRTDLALLKVDVNRKFTYVQFADDSKIRVGDWVVAVGNPFGLGGTVTSGIISARGRDIGSGPYDDYLQIDAAVNRGNSGGPAFNLNGEVVGINTAIFSPSGGNVGIAFAIPASVAKDVIADLQKDGKVERGWLGVQIQPVSKDIAESLGLSEASGALVVSPQAGSPGDKAGIKQGRIGGMAPNTKVEISLWRGGKSQPVTVTLGDLASDDASKATPAQNDDKGGQSSSEKVLSSLGLTVAPADDGNGLAITDVDPDSDAAARGLKTGEKITSVNNQQVASAADIEKILEQAKKDGRSKALFQIQTDDGSRFIALDIDQG